MSKQLSTQIRSPKVRKRIESYIETHPAADCTTHKIAGALGLPLDVVAVWLLVILSKSK